MSWRSEIESPVSAARMFHAAILDWHKLGPEIAPEILLTGTTEGNVRQLNFTSAMPFPYVKERIDFVDDQNFECDLTITEGGQLKTSMKSARIKYKIVEASGGDGCIIKVVTTAMPLPGIKLDDEAAEGIAKAKETTVAQFKAAEAYLLANPDKYTAPPPDTRSRIQARPIVYGDAIQVLDDFDYGFSRNNYYDNSRPASSRGHGGHDRRGNFYGIQANGIVFGDAVQQMSGFGSRHENRSDDDGVPENADHFHGIQMNGKVFGKEVQQWGNNVYEKKKRGGKQERAE